MPSIEELSAEIEELRRVVHGETDAVPCWLCGQLSQGAKRDMSGPARELGPRAAYLCPTCWRLGPISDKEKRGGCALAAALGVRGGVHAARRYHYVVSHVAPALRVRAWCDTEAEPSTKPFAHIGRGTLAKAKGLLGVYDLEESPAQENADE